MGMMKSEQAKGRNSGIRSAYGRFWTMTLTPANSANTCVAGSNGGHTIRNERLRSHGRIGAAVLPNIHRRHARILEFRVEFPPSPRRKKHGEVQLSPAG